MNFKENYGDAELRALSWKEPFASLMLEGKIETRVWNAKYRGLVLICASKNIYSATEILHISGEKQLHRIADIQTNNNRNNILLKPGQAIAIGRLVDSRFMLKSDEDKCFVEYHEPWLHTSKWTGKKSWKRLWCHVYEDVHPIFPFDWKGSQGWGKVPDEIKDKIQFVL